MTREEINEEKQKKISRENNYDRNKKIVIFCLKLFALLTIGITLFVTYTTYVSTVKLSVREYRIVDNSLPDNFDGLKLIQFSDLHYGSTMFEENLKSIKNLINDRKPDIIVFTGDLIDPNYKISNKQKEILSQELHSLSASLGKYAVLGDEDSNDIITVYSQSDFQILNNDYDLIFDKNNQPIMLVGLSSLLEGNQDIKKAYQYFSQEVYDANIYTITLVHEPDSADDIIQQFPNTNLILSGHSHNGSVRTPFSHIPFERKNGAKKYNQDFYQIDNTKLYISSGLGTNQSSIRLFCRPSINFFRFSSK